MKGLRSFTEKVIVGKKIDSFWGEPQEGQTPIPKRQLVLLTEDGAHTVSCVEEVLKKVEEFKPYRFVLDNDVASKKVKIVDVLLDNKN